MQREARVKLGSKWHRAFKGAIFFLCAQKGYSHCSQKRVWKSPRRR